MSGWIGRGGRHGPGLSLWLEARTFFLILSVKTAAWPRFPKCDSGITIRLSGQPTGHSPLRGSHRPRDRRFGMSVSCVLLIDIFWPLGSSYQTSPPGARCRAEGPFFSSLFSVLYRVSQEECARLREGVPYAKIYRYNPKHLCPKWNGYGDNGQ